MRIFLVALWAITPLHSIWAQSDSVPADGEIRGQVVSEHSGEPLRSAVISLQSAQAGASQQSIRREARSAIDGRYLLRGLPPGEYQLRIRKTGYEGNSPTSRRAAVTDADPVVQLDIRLRRSASVSGMVLDPDGDPLPDTPVVLFRWESSSGRSSLRFGRSARSDDRGRYRMWGMRPDDYVLAALPLALPAAPGLWIQEMAPVYYPGAPTPRGGVPLKLRWNLDIEGADLRVPAAEETAIEGAVTVLQTGEVCLDCRLNILTGAGALLGTITVDRQGTFSLRGLPPGRYLLVAEARRTLRGTAEAIVVRGEPTLIRVEVGGAGNVSGRVVAEHVPSNWSGPDDPAVNVNVNLRGDPARHLRFRRSAKPAAGAGGRFLIEGLPAGRYLISIGRGNDGGYLRGAMLGGRPLARPEIDVPPEQTAQGLEVRVGFDSATLKGRVMADGLPTQGIAIALPDDYGEGFSVGHLGSFRGSDGMFEIPGVPPGRYTVFAVSRYNRFDLGSEKTREFLRRAGKKIKLNPGETMTVEPPFVAEPD